VAYISSGSDYANMKRAVALRLRRSLVAARRTSDRTDDIE
jgi:hypothetical protein